MLLDSSSQSFPQGGIVKKNHQVSLRGPAEDSPGEFCGGTRCWLTTLTQQCVESRFQPFCFVFAFFIGTFLFSSRFYVGKCDVKKEHWRVKRDNEASYLRLSLNKHQTNTLDERKSVRYTILHSFQMVHLVIDNCYRSQYFDLWNKTVHILNFWAIFAGRGIHINYMYL